MHEPDTAPALPTCASCGAKLKGDYCRKCGEKKIVPERDFSLWKFLNQTMWHFVHFDSKLIKSCVLLFSKPGFLTAEWIAGRRVGYMKPLQLFIFAGVLFYFFLPTTTAYFSAAADLVNGYETQDFMHNAFHFDVGKLLAEKSAALQLDEKTLSESLIKEAAKQSKTWLFLIIPFWAALIYPFFKQKMPWAGPHLIFAMHGLTFYILFDLSLHAIITLTSIPSLGRSIFLFLTLSFPIYQALAVRRVYGFPWPQTLLKTTAIAAGFSILLLLYRQLITVATLFFL
ncbi:MAG: DUF3667 domain-containing protein [Bacteroidota bacterium]